VLRKISLLCILVAATLVVEPAAAANKVRANGNFGIGLGGGTFATGVSMKYFLDAPLSVQGTIGWWRGRYWCSGRHCGYGGGDSFALSADLLWEMPRFAGNEAVEVAWMLGGGVGLGIDDFDNDFGLGAAFVIGIELNIQPVPIDIVLEYRPGIYFLPGVSFDPVNFTGHIRYFF